MLRGCMMENQSGSHGILKHAALHVELLGQRETNFNHMVDFYCIGLSNNSMRLMGFVKLR